MHSTLLTYHVRLFLSVGVLSMYPGPACSLLTGGELGLVSEGYWYLGPTVIKCLNWISRTNGPYDLLDCRGQGSKIPKIEAWQHSISRLR